MESDELYCYVHPKQATMLRCNRCGRPICARCAVRSPVGYRCRNCVREMQKVFDNARWYDYPVAFVAAGVVAAVGAGIASTISFFGLIICGLAGLAAEWVAQRATHFRRSRHLWLAAIAGALLGASLASFAPMLMMGLLMMALERTVSVFEVAVSIGWASLNVGVIVVVLAGRLRGRW
jgi:hypothetical protein